MKKFQVINLGCKVNAVESANFMAGLLSKGYEQGALEDCELVIVNTCTVTSDADKKSRKSVRQALKASKGLVYVTGCSSEIDAKIFEDINPRVKVCAKADLLKDLNDAEFLRKGPEFKTRVGIKIQDGCNNACSYCLVRYARGRSKSLPFQQALSESKRYIDAGVRELVLSGINIGAYSYHGKGLVELLAELIKIPCNEPYRFRISSIEPQDLSDELIELVMNSQGRICRHF
ncbi:MAG: radical SAM protein, partial [Eggerthellaceae bacterium]|nr:radical SAM protein [Eggerthellaceae bacterium]